MIVFLIFLALYMIPTVHFARTQAWQLQQSYKRRHFKTYPERKVDMESHPYVYINSRITKKHKVCGRCGGDKDFHPQGEFKNLRFYHGTEEHNVCAHFTEWDGQVRFWPRQMLDESTHVPSMILPSLFLSLGWFPMLLWRGYGMVKPDYSKFALPPASVRKEIELKEREEKIDRQERELKIGPYSE